jgi:hypothetical protein
MLPATDTIPAGRWRSAAHPLVYEINTWPWLDGLAATTGRSVDLGSVPDAQWDDLAEQGWDAVWLMGVWRRSPAGAARARSDPALVADFQAALPGYRPEDVVGSPYCVRGYVVDDRLGGPGGLAAAREALARRGVGLMLDFVPNHVAPDHPWTTGRPELFVAGTAADRRDDPGSFVEVGGRVLANGRDPFFPAWPDVVQLNAFSPALRAAAAGTLAGIAEQCDAIRCDMAMLMMNDVFARTWGDRVGGPPREEYWPAVIGAVRRVHPDVRFLAEAYWDREWALQQQGFDFCYDKRLYDRLVHEGAELVRRHLEADTAYQDGLLRFVENHDEPRAATVLDRQQEKAVVVATLTQTGARLVHQGQVEGWRRHLPVFLGRSEPEPTDEDLAAFHRRLLAALADPTFRSGAWQLCERSGWPDDASFEHLVAWCWEGDRRWLVVVNLGAGPATGRVRAPWPDLRGRSWRLVDPTQGTDDIRSGDDLCDGLYVRLDPWHWHLFRLDPTEDGS